MRLNFVVRPGTEAHLDVSVLNTIAQISIWAGQSLLDLEFRYSLEFPGRLWHKEMSESAKCDDAARIAIAHWLGGTVRQLEALHLVCNQDTQRWAGRLAWSADQQ
jgi:hypothetical protein